jgi:DNA-binding CsgD family transcriptional regulator
MAHLSRVEAEEGDYESARAYAQRAVELGRSLGDAWTIPVALRTLAEVARAQGDHGQAAAPLAESLDGFRTAGYRHEIAECLEALADISGEQGRHERAARLQGAAEALREQIAVQRRPPDRSDRHPATSTALAGLRVAAWAQGRVMTPEEAIEYALSGEEVELTSITRTAVSDESSADEPPDERLTHREKEVATLVARGLTNRQIAKELVISEHTVENHVAKILKKLGLDSRTQIAAWATRQGLPTASAT